MRLKSVTWRNFKSYSNIPTTICFDDKSSLNLIMGENGSGKSSIAEVITFALYGKIENFNTSDIPNRVNKNLYTKIELDCDGHDVVIERGLAPAVFGVKIDGNNIDTAGKSNVQTMLEEGYFKLPYSVFCNTLVLSISEYKSLINLSAADKRNIIDKIFGFTVYNNLNKLTKDEIKNVSSKMSENEGTIRASNQYREEYTRKIEEINNSSITDDELNELRSRIDEIEEKNKSNLEILDKLKTAKDELFSSTNDNGYRYRELEGKIQSIDKKISLIDSGRCPTCGSSLDTDDFKKERDRLIEDREKYVDEQGMIKSNLKQIRSKIDAIERKQSSVQENINRTNIIELKSDLKYKSSIKDRNVDSFIELRNKLDEKLAEINNEHRMLSKVLESLNLLSEVFGENGIKKYIATRYTPIINKYIDDVLLYMGSNYIVEFDDKFNGNIKLNGYTVKYSTLSTGEKKRIDFACIIAIIKFLKLQLGEMNLLFLDELFSNIDINGVGDMVELLKKLSDELNLNIYLIHHAPLEGINFDRILRAYKPDGFSRLEETENG